MWQHKRALVFDAGRIVLWAIGLFLCMNLLFWIAKLFSPSILFVIAVPIFLSPIFLFPILWSIYSIKFAVLWQEHILNPRENWQYSSWSNKHKQYLYTWAPALIVHTIVLTIIFFAWESKKILYLMTMPIELLSVIIWGHNLSTPLEKVIPIALGLSWFYILARLSPVLSQIVWDHGISWKRAWHTKQRRGMDMIFYGAVIFIMHTALVVLFIHSYTWTVIAIFGTMMGDKSGTMTQYEEMRAIFSQTIWLFPIGAVSVFVNFVLVVFLSSFLAFAHKTSSPPPTIKA